MSLLNSNKAATVYSIAEYYKFQTTLSTQRYKEYLQAESFVSLNNGHQYFSNVHDAH